jgi:hypothetical protein
MARGEIRRMDYREVRTRVGGTDQDDMIRIPIGLLRKEGAGAEMVFQFS